jgi:hypothetical protein
MDQLGNWLALNYQFLVVIGGLILTNLNYRVSFAVLELKVGALKERQDLQEIHILDLIKQKT